MKHSPCTVRTSSSNSKIFSCRLPHYTIHHIMLYYILLFYCCILSELFFSSLCKWVFTFDLQLLVTVQLLKVKQIWGTMTLTHCKRLNFFMPFFLLIT